MNTMIYTEKTTKDILEATSKEFEAIRLTCKEEADYEALNAKIKAFNDLAFNATVCHIADSAYPVDKLINAPCAPQFYEVKQTEKGNRIALKEDGKRVHYSDMARFIAKNNKNKEAKKLSVPFANADYVLFNIYGHNVSKEALTRLECHSLSVLEGFNSDLACFKASSNAKLKEQLQILFDRIIEVSGNNEILKVNAIERHSKLIAMELVKYKSDNHTLTIGSADKLIDLIINQFIISRDKMAITVKSKLDIHKEAK